MSPEPSPIPSRRGGRPACVAAFLAAGAGVALLAADQGGFFQRSWAPATLSFAAVASLALVLVERLEPARGAYVLVGGLAGVTGWTACSALWSASSHSSLDEAKRTLVYLAAAVALATLAAAGGSLGLPAGAAAGIVGIACYSLVDRAVNGARFDATQGTLLQKPLGYANALGALCAVALVVLLALAWTERRPLYAVPAAVLLPALALTHSRGSWIALAAGAAVGAAAVLGRRAAALAGGALAAALAVLSAIAAFGTPAFLQSRGAYWHVAWHVAADHPLAGAGAGTFDRAWIELGDLVRWQVTLDAHSLYLETLAELGAVGLLAVLLALALPLRWTTHPAALAGATVFLVHAGLDWDWEMPAVTVAGIACIAAFPRSGRALGARTRAGTLALALALVALGGAQVLRRFGLF